MDFSNLWLGVYACSFILTGLLAGTSVYILPEKVLFSFFWFHPFLMSVGWFLCIGYGILIKKPGGKKNTIAHGILAFLGATCISGGFAIIFINKNRLGKNHFTTLHGTSGFIVFLLMFVPLLFGLGLIPDIGPLRSHQLSRTIHKYVARTLFCIALCVIILGTKKFFQYADGTHNPVSFRFFVFGCIIVGLFMILCHFQKSEGYEIFNENKNGKEDAWNNAELGQIEAPSVKSYNSTGSGDGVSGPRDRNPNNQKSHLNDSDI